MSDVFLPERVHLLFWSYVYPFIVVIYGLKVDYDNSR